MDPIKNVWHCFGCDAGGSVIDFVMKKDSLTFREAADKLLVDGGQIKRGFGSGRTAEELGRLSARWSNPSS